MILHRRESVKRLARLAALGAGLFAAVGLGGCAKLTLAWADLSPDGPTARPPVLAAFDGDPAVSSAQEWSERRTPLLREAFESNVYGYFPQFSRTEFPKRRVVSESAFDGLGRVEEITLRVDAAYNDADPHGTTFHVVTIIPKGAKGPVPTILMATFCPNHNTVPVAGVTRFEGGMNCDGESRVVHYVFGRYIETPPIETILKHGYAIATFYPGEIVPDAPEAGLAALKRLSPGWTDDDTRWGAVAAWAWGFSRVVDYLEMDRRFDNHAVIAWGHSREGKAALVAAAFDPRIDAVISHQSGTGGASLSREKKGETVAQITKAYPHWFSKTYAGYAGRTDALPVDQHQLLALIAPRPVLLGNARRDVWSDPNGAFRAALGANPAYRLFGSAGMTAERLDDFRPGDDIAFWLRPGTHGIVEEDWPAFLKFLDAHFGKGGA